jgi:hypothetical protein
MRKNSKPANCIVLWEAVWWLVSSWWQCTCHFVFLCMNIWLKENHPFTASLLTRLSAVQLAFYFQSWRLHVMVSTMIHADCMMHFAKFQTVYIMQCLKQEHDHQACCVQSTGDCHVKVTTVVRN